MNPIVYFVLAIGFTLLGFGIGFMTGVVNGMHEERKRRKEQIKKCLISRDDILEASKNINAHQQEQEKAKKLFNLDKRI